MRERRDTSMGIAAILALVVLALIAKMAQA
jgi:type II secretory pathway component PulK